MSRISRIRSRWAQKLRLFPCPDCGRRDAVAVNYEAELFYCFGCGHGGSTKPITVEATT